MVTVKNAYFDAMISMGFLKYFDIKKNPAEIFVSQLLKVLFFLLLAALDVDLIFFTDHLIDYMNFVGN